MEALDTFVSENSENIIEFMAPYTVPIFLDAHQDRSASNGSGVLIKIREHHLLLTAGHCIDKWENAFSRNLKIKVAPSIQLDVLKFNKAHVAEKDYGFFLLDPCSINQLSGISKTFLPSELICIDKVPSNSIIFISGYPQIKLSDTDKIIGQHFFLYGDSCNSGYGEAGRTIRGWAYRTDIERRTGIMLDSTVGLSGGACWYMACAEAPVTWDQNLMRLCAIHISGGTTISSANVAEVPIFNHLRLIHDKVPEARQAIEETWFQTN